MPEAFCKRAMTAREDDVPDSFCDLVSATGKRAGIGEPFESETWTTGVPSVVKSEHLMVGHIQHLGHMLLTGNEQKSIADDDVKHLELEMRGIARQRNKPRDTGSSRSVNGMEVATIGQTIDRGEEPDQVDPAKGLVDADTPDARAGNLRLPSGIQGPPVRIHPDCLVHPLARAGTVGVAEVADNVQVVANHLE